MPEFILDTTGGVENVPAVRGHASGDTLDVRFHGHIEWRYLDAFTQGYIEALFFTESDIGGTPESFDPENGAPLPVDAGFSDLAPCALASIIADCGVFQRDNAAALESAYARDYDAAQAGRDYWFTRNGHGVGYWDREQLKADDSAEYERLTQVMIESRGDNAAWGAALAERQKIEAESIGARLTTAACQHDNADAYQGDDGKVYLS